MKSTVRGRKAEILAAGLLLLMGINCLSVIARKSVTNDENIHIPAGYAHLVSRDFQFNNPHPPTPKILSALPLVFLHPSELSRDEWQDRDQDFERAAIDHFWFANSDRFESISFWARVPMIALTIVLGFVIFAFARRLFGARAAVLAVALFSLEPTILAHGRIVHTDIPSALGFVLFCFASYRYVTRPGLRQAVWLGLATGFAPLTKFSMVTLAPLALIGASGLILFAPRLSLRRRSAIVHVAIVLGLSLLVINGAYFFHSRPFSGTDAEWIADTFGSHATNIARSVRVLNHVVPTDFLMGIYWQIHHSSEGHPAALFGQYSQFGWWYYFPAAFALKTTVPFLLCSVVALLWTVWQLATQRERGARLRFLFVLLPFLAFTTYVMTSRINIGVRYYLPAYPFLFIMSAALLDWLLRVPARRWIGPAAIASVLGWSAIEVVRAYPNYVPYMNEITFAHPHWWYLSDSNVEWGEDMRGLAGYLKAHDETNVRCALLGSYWPLQLYGIKYFDEFADNQPPTKYLAIGASYLNGSTVPLGPPGSGRETDERRVNYFDEYRQRTPEAIIGNSIYVYRLR